MENFQRILIGLVQIHNVMQSIKDIFLIRMIVNSVIFLAQFATGKQYVTAKNVR